MDDATQSQDHPGQRQDMSDAADVQDGDGMYLLREDVMDEVGHDAHAGEREPETGRRWQRLPQGSQHHADSGAAGDLIAIGN